MSDKKSAEVSVLSKESLKSEGIEIKLTQNDVIEMLVDEQVSRVESTYESLVERVKEFEADTREEFKNAAHAQLVNLKIPEGCEIIDVKHYMDNESKGKRLTLMGIHINEHYRTGAKMYSSTNRSAFYLECKGLVKVTIKKEIEGMIFTAEIDLPPFHFKHKEGTEERLEMINREIIDFCGSMPREGINPKEIARSIKNKFTKEMVKSMSPELQKALKKGFNLL